MRASNQGPASGRAVDWTRPGLGFLAASAAACSRRASHPRVPRACQPATQLDMDAELGRIASDMRAIDAMGCAERRGLNTTDEDTIHWDEFGQTLVDLQTAAESVDANEVLQALAALPNFEPEDAEELTALAHALQHAEMSPRIRSLLVQALVTQSASGKPVSPRLEAVAERLDQIVSYISERTAPSKEEQVLWPPPPPDESSEVSQVARVPVLHTLDDEPRQQGFHQGTSELIPLAAEPRAMLLSELAPAAGMGFVGDGSVLVRGIVQNLELARPGDALVLFPDVYQKKARVKEVFRKAKERGVEVVIFANTKVDVAKVKNIVGFRATAVLQATPQLLDAFYGELPTSMQFLVVQGEDPFEVRTTSWYLQEVMRALHGPAAVSTVRRGRTVLGSGCVDISHELDNCMVRELLAEAAVAKSQVCVLESTPGAQAPNTFAGITPDFVVNLGRSDTHFQSGLKQWRSHSTKPVDDWRSRAEGLTLSVESQEDHVISKYSPKTWTENSWSYHVAAITAFRWRSPEDLSTRKALRAYHHMNTDMALEFLDAQPRPAPRIVAGLLLPVDDGHLSPRLAIRTSDLTQTVALPITGTTGAKAALAALSCALATRGNDGVTDEEFADAVAALSTAPPGGLEMHAIRKEGDSQPRVSTVLHAASGAREVARWLQILKHDSYHFLAATRLTVVIGCSGETCRGDRAKIGWALRRWADRIFLTSADSRSEPPMQIIEDVLEALRHQSESLDAGKEIHVMADRTDAIKSAICSAVGDGGEKGSHGVVLVIGEGERDYLDVAGPDGEVRRWMHSDRQIIKETHEFIHRWLDETDTAADITTIPWTTMSKSGPVRNERLPGRSLHWSHSKRESGTLL